MTFNKLKSLEGQTVVIAGAAGGVGWAVAESMAALGARVIGIVRRDVEAFQIKLNTLAGNHTALLADITKKAQLAQVISNITQCDILVNSAGHSKVVPHKDLTGLDDELFDSIIKTNLSSVFSTIRHFVPLLKQSPNGLIVNISSAAAIRTGGSNLAYAAAKAGIESLTRNLAVALAPIRVVSVCPSALDTGFLDLPAEFYNKVAAATPLKRIGTAQDVANAVEAIATTMRFATGNSIVVDGGRTL
jgi:NAD(P)-dependent dehydrogenase (short-subunit alcohol dehydrogenase family)